MKATGADVVLTGSQKALAVAPGIAVIVLSRSAIERVARHHVKSMYFDLADYLRDGERGQTPYTPAVGTLLQIHKRLEGLKARGVDAETNRVRSMAEDFRARIVGLPLRIATSCPSNCVTPLRPNEAVSAHRIFEVLKDEYSIMVCPNGGDLKHKMFRVGHLGALTVADNVTLVQAFQDLIRRGIL
jgi:aspartate aminotransferase-like enzyme